MARQQDSRLKIYKALEQLVQVKSISDIKVIDVCRLSGVPRSTFYTNFTDIFSVPQWLWDDMMGTTLYMIGNTLTWDQGHRKMFQNLLAHKALFIKIYWENDNNSILEYGYRGGYNAVKNNVELHKNHTWTDEELLDSGLHHQSPGKPDYKMGKRWDGCSSRKSSTNLQHAHPPILERPGE